jgi:hypothetical protein
MKVIAEFVDCRNGKRYLPGAGDTIDPALDAEQAERLKKAGCLRDGAEVKRAEPEQPAKAAAPVAPAATTGKQRPKSKK